MMDTRRKSNQWRNIFIHSSLFVSSIHSDLSTTCHLSSDNSAASPSEKWLDVLDWRPTFLWGVRGQRTAGTSISSKRQLKSWWHLMTVVKVMQNLPSSLSLDSVIEEVPSVWVVLAMEWMGVQLTFLANAVPAAEEKPLELLVTDPADSAVRLIWLTLKKIQEEISWRCLQRKDVSVMRGVIKTRGQDEVEENRLTWQLDCWSQPFFCSQFF